MRISALVLALATFGAAQEKRPNILWIWGDDLGPDLGCYGQKLARTPNLDKLASEGVRFTRCFTTAPVCSPSRSALMTGMYQTAIGAHHHRSHRDDGYTLPPGVRTITDHFRAAGYFTANVTSALAPGAKGTGKTDFNFTVAKPFDGREWSELKSRQPFYAQVNFSAPHRGGTWPEARRRLKDLVDPAKVVLPPYYPDHPKVRDDYANYLDAVNLLDLQVGEVLKRLEEDGLAGNTAVIFLGDNGQCHYRGKQFLYDGGIHIPLIIRWPGKLRPGTVREDLVSAIDISATSLAAAGVEIPKLMHGRDLFAGGERDCIVAARDRCDETEDRIRCVRTKKHKYIRNYFPDRPYTQPNKYKERSYPALAVGKELHAAGKLTPEQAAFFAPTRPAEELYDLESDPHEVKNLAASPAHAKALEELRTLLDRWIKETGDPGEIPEKK